MTRPPHLVIPGFPPPSSPTSLLRHPRPRSGTYALVILAPDPKPIIPPSFRPSSRYPWAGRGNHHNHHPPHPHPSTVVPAKERHPVPRYGAGTQGTGAETTTTVIPHQHPLPPYRRAGVGTSPRTPIRGRYPGDARGYPHKHPKSQTAHTPKPSSLRHSPPAQFVIPSEAEESKPFIHSPHHPPTKTIIPNRPTS